MLTTLNIHSLDQGKVTRTEEEYYRQPQMPRLHIAGWLRAKLHVGAFNVTWLRSHKA